MGFEIHTLQTPGLGDRSYVLIQDGVAVAIDPQRDIVRVESLLEGSNAKLAGVLETHIHNDYITGGWELAKRHSAKYLVPAGPTIGFDAVRVSDLQDFNFGPISIRSISTPGHTDAHTLYQFVSGDDQLAFTGGSLLYGTVGRTDLLGKDRAVMLAKKQYESMRRLQELLDPRCRVLPTHGFGSFCSAEPANSEGDSFQEQLDTNFVFQLEQSEFVEQLLAKFGNYPAYYAFMGPRNAFGPTAGEVTLPPRLSYAETLQHRDRGARILDVRNGKDFAAGHISRSISIPVTGSFATWTGWILPINEPLVIVASSDSDAAQAVTELFRIGFDQIVGYTVVVGVEQFEARLDATSFAAGIPTDKFLLDVREVAEVALGRIPGAVSIPLSEFRSFDFAPLQGKDVFVYCQAGFRSLIASSFLSGAGISATWIQGDLPAHLLTSP